MIYLDILQLNFTGVPVGHDGLQLRDVKSLVNAVMEFGSVDSPMGDASQQHLMREAAQLTGATAVTMLELTGFNPGGVWRATRFDQLNLPHAVDLIQEYLRSENHDDPSEPPFRALPGVHVVATRQDLVSDAEWYRSPHVMELRRAMRMDHCAYSMIYDERPGRVNCLCLFREWGDKAPFSSRDKSVLEVLHHSWTKLRSSKRGSSSTVGLKVALSPRLSEVLALLQQGLSEKEVSERLGVSTHTTHAHVVALYRRFGVTSRAELLAHTMLH